MIIDKKILLTGAIVAAFLISSCIIVTFYKTEADDKEINLLAQVNTEGSGIYLDTYYGEPSDYATVDADGKVTYYKDKWRGKVFGTPGVTTIQQMMLHFIVLNDLGLKFAPYDDTADTSSTSEYVYYQPSIANATAFESDSNRFLAGGIIWQPQLQAILENVKCKHSGSQYSCKEMLDTAEIEPDHTCCVIASSHAYTQKNPNTTVRFLAGYMDAVDWVNAALADTSSEEYQELVALAKAKTGINDDAVIQKSLATVTYTYGNSGEGDTDQAPLTHLTGTIEELVSDFYKYSSSLKRSMSDLGFSSIHRFAERYVDDGYLSQAIDVRGGGGAFTKTSVKVGVIAGDIHQIAIHVAIEKGFFQKYAIEVSLSASTNGAGVATSLQNGECDFGVMGAPPITIAVINSGLVNSRGGRG